MYLRIQGKPQTLLRATHTREPTRPRRAGWGVHTRLEDGQQTGAEGAQEVVSRQGERRELASAGPATVHPVRLNEAPEALDTPNHTQTHRSVRRSACFNSEHQKKEEEEQRKRLGEKKLPHKR